MDIFRLRVFISAAKNLSFTKCSKELFISQPAVSKHILELEHEFNVPLFHRKGSQLELTTAGSTLLSHATAIMNDYDRMNYEMGLLANTVTGELRLGASTTISQYVLPPILAQFSELFPQVKISVKSDNSEHIEAALFNNDIDLGLVENYSRQTGLQYENLMDDELVMVGDLNKKYGKTEEVTLDELQSLPLILRENGSGTLEVIERQLEQRGITLPMLNVVMQLGSTEAIKSFVQNSDTLAILSVVSVRKELVNNQLHVIDIEGFDLVRHFDFVYRKSEHNQLSQRFMDFTFKSL